MIFRMKLLGLVNEVMDIAMKSRSAAVKRRKHDRRGQLTSERNLSDILNKGEIVEGHAEHDREQTIREGR